MRLPKVNQIVVTFALVCLLSTVEAQSNPVKEYESLVDTLKGGQTNISFNKLRMLYPKMPWYRPYDESRNALRDKMLQTLAQKKYQDVLQKAYKILAKNVVDLESHMVAHLAHLHLKNSEQSSFHRAVLQGLLDSILASGDGNTPQTAFVVISPEEEHMVLKTLNLSFKAQSLIQNDGHWYDKIDTGERDVYFCIDIPYGWLKGHLPKQK